MAREFEPSLGLGHPTVVGDPGDFVKAQRLVEIKIQIKTYLYPSFNIGKF